MLYASNKEAMAMLLTGIYIPPRQTTGLTMDELKSETTPQVKRDTADRYSLLVGDLNYTSWSTL